MALFGGLAATIMLLLSSGPTRTGDNIAMVIERADEAMPRPGRTQVGEQPAH